MLKKRCGRCNLHCESDGVSLGPVAMVLIGERESRAAFHHAFKCVWRPALQDKLAAEFPSLVLARSPPGPHDGEVWPYRGLRKQARLGAF